MKASAPKHLLLAFIAITVLTFCSKNKQATTTIDVNMLTNKAWLLENIKVDIGANGTIDSTRTPTTCDADDSFTFNADGKGIYDKSLIKCDASEERISNFAWQQKNNTTINATIPALGWSGDATIITLNNAAFEFSFNYSYSGFIIRNTVKLKR
jgi:hypothetical protein